MSATTLSPRLLPGCNLNEEGKSFYLPPHSYGKWKTAEYSGIAATVSGTFFGLILMFLFIDKNMRIPRNYFIAFIILNVFVATMVHAILTKKKLKKEKQSCIDKNGQLFMY